jgi:hypothetical protein
MLKRCFCFVAAASLATVWLPTPAAASDAAAPTVIVRVRSIDNLIADLKYVTGLIGHGAEAKQLDAAIKKTFPNGFQGIDTKRPIGLYAIADPDFDPEKSRIALLLPVSDEKAFIGLMERLGSAKASKDEDGLYTITAENATSAVFFRFIHKYAYATIKDKSTLDKTRLLTPDRVFSARNLQTLSITFRLDQIPDAYRQALFSQIDARLLSLDEDHPAGETKVQHALRVEAARQVGALFAALVKEGKELYFALDIDRKTQELSVELNIVARPQTPLAASLEALGQESSLFAGMVQAEAAMSLVAHGGLPDSLRKVLGPVIDEGIQTNLAKEKDTSKREPAEKILKALAPSLKAGELDIGVSLTKTGANPNYTIMAGIKLKEGRDIDRAVRDLLKNLPEDARKAIKVESEAGEATVYRLDVHERLDADARRLLGDNPFYLALRSDVLLVAGGAGGLQALKDALASNASTAPPVQLNIAVARLVPLMGKKAKADPVAAAKKAFGDGTKNNDRIQFRVEGGKALRIRLGGNAAVLQFLSLMDGKKGAE